MTIKTRLILSLSLLTILISGFVTAGFVVLSILGANTSMLVTDHIKPIRDLKIVADAYAVSIVDNVHKTRAGTVGWAESLQTMQTAQDLIARTWSAEIARPKNAEDEGLAASVAATMDAATGEIAELVQVIAARDMPRLVDFAQARMYPAIDPISSAVSTYIERLQDNAVADLEALEAFENLVKAAMIAAAIVASVVILYAGFVILRSVAHRLESMQVALSRVASGHLDATIPYTEHKDEIGRIAAAAEIFRKGGIELREMTAREDIDRQARDGQRKQMMAELQAGFGSVVQAARAGDLSSRVNQTFADDEMNRLAADVNLLLNTVETGIAASAEVLAALAEADLRARVTGNFEGAFARLRDDTNAVADKMSEVVGDMRRTSGALRSATSEILAGANDLSERTTRQAATIEETSAAMEQLSNTVAENARSADTASTHAELAAGTAGQSGDEMRLANEAMTRITASSQQIANIIGMIDDIAFQTNLLALNASVEAARAGDAGRGFAVVAQEVRRLAQSAAESSSEVKALIARSEGEVKTGARLVQSAADSLKSVLESVHQNVQQIRSIADASRKQAGAIQEITISVRQLDEMTQHNAALVEETNATIEQTETQVVALDSLISVFKLESAADQVVPFKVRTSPPRRPMLPARQDALAREWSEF